MEDNLCIEDDLCWKTQSHLVNIVRVRSLVQDRDEPIRSDPTHPIPQGFSIIILKPYVKVVTQSEKLEWWIILMGDCVNILY